MPVFYQGKEQPEHLNGVQQGTNVARWSHFGLTGGRLFSDVGISSMMPLVSDTPTLLLDLDGTLTDPESGIVSCLREALRQLGNNPPPDSELRHFIGPPLHDVFAALLATTDETRISLGMAKYRERFEVTGMFDNRVFPHTVTTLDRLNRRGFKLYVVTSKPHVYAEKILTYFDLRKFFVGVYGPALDSTHRDKAELLARLLAETGTRADRCLMIGDRKFDVLGAHAVGMRSVGVLWGFGSRDELVEAGADVLVASFSELEKACLSLFLTTESSRPAPPMPKA